MLAAVNADVTDVTHMQCMHVCGTYHSTVSAQKSLAASAAVVVPALLWG